MLKQYNVYLKEQHIVCRHYNTLHISHSLFSLRHLIRNGGWMQIEPSTSNILRIFILQVEDKFWLIPGVNLFSNYLQI